MRPPIPTQLVAGDTWSFTWPLDCGFETYTAANGWLLTLALRGPASLDLTASTVDDQFVTTTTSVPDPDHPGQFLAQSNLTPGQYAWQARVTNSTTGESHEIARGQVEVIANIAALATGADTRSWVKKTLDAVRAVLQNVAGYEEQSYQINGRALQYASRDELLRLEHEFALRYRREQAAANGDEQTIGTVRFGFGMRHHGDWR